MLTVCIRQSDVRLYCIYIPKLKPPVEMCIAHYTAFITLSNFAERLVSFQR